MILDKDGNVYVHQPKLQELNISNIHEKYFEEDNGGVNINNYKQEWVNWGSNNLKPQKLLYFSNNSPILKGIQNKEITRITGDEIVYEDTNEPIGTEYPFYKTSEFVTLEDFINSLSSDLSKLSTFSFSVEYQRNAEKVANMYYMPSTSIRSGKKMNDGVVQNYFISTHWEKMNSIDRNNYQPKEVKSWNSKKAGNAQLYYFKTKNQLDHFYADVSWESSLNYAILDYEISNFHLANIRNGLSPGLIISFPQSYSPEFKQKMSAEFNKKRGPQGTGSKMILNGTGTSDSLPTITQLGVSDLDKQFNLLNTTLNEKISLSTGIPRILAGLDTNIGLSNGKDVLIGAESEWFKNEISTKRKYIIDAINEINDFNGYRRIAIKDKLPTLLSFVSEARISQAISDEMILNELGIKMKPKTDGEN